MRLTSKILITSLALVCAFTSMAHAQGSVSIPLPVAEPYTALPAVSVDKLRLIENLFFEMTNDVRTSAGVKPLIKNEALQAAARSHSQDMAVNHFFSHPGKGLDLPADRIQAASVCGPGVDCILNAETLSQMNFVNTLGLGTYFNTGKFQERCRIYFLGSILS